MILCLLSLVYCASLSKEEKMQRLGFSFPDKNGPGRLLNLPYVAVGGEACLLEVVCNRLPTLLSKLGRNYLLSTYICVCIYIYVLLY